MNRYLVKFREILLNIAKVFGLQENPRVLSLSRKLMPWQFRRSEKSYPLLLEDLKPYLASDSHRFFLKMVNTEARPGFTCNFNEKISLDLPTSLRLQDEVWMSFAIVAPLPASYGLAKLVLKTELTNSGGKPYGGGTFEVPLDGGNSLISHLAGAGWVSWKLPLSELLAEIPPEVLRVSMEARLYFEGSEIPLSAPNEAAFLGFPQLVKPKMRPKKIICISCESLTDPRVLALAFPEECRAIDAQVYSFMEKYRSARHAYAQGDSTLPSSNAQFSGLLALQHGIGCYNPGPNTPNTPVRNDAILSSAQLLKRAGYLCFASTMYTELGPDYGCARGFDSYINIDTGIDPIWPNLENAVIPAMASALNVDSFHYVHLDSLLHVPFINARYSAFSGVPNLLDLSDRKRRVNLYVSNLNKMFQQLQVLDDFVERNRSQIDFLVLITGDHGHGLEPWWGNHKDYALYEQRVRVPFMMRDTTGHFENSDKPMNASIEIFRKTIAFAGIELPEMLRDLPQYRPDFSGISISETLLHPDDDDYCLVLSDAKYKFAQVLKLDYDSRKVLGATWERLYRYDNGLPNEIEDLRGTLPEIFQKFKQKAEILVRESLVFNAKYPTKSLLEPSRLWSVNDPRSPSKANRRAKKIKPV